MRGEIAITVAALALAACGKQGELMRRPPPGQAAAIDPTKPLPSTLLQVPTQYEPARADDPLRKSEQRRNDPFNLPPQR